jgi:hypothetical protein
MVVYSMIKQANKGGDKPMANNSFKTRLDLIAYFIQKLTGARIEDCNKEALHMRTDRSG